MPDKLTGEISLTHQMGNTSIKLDCDTNGDTTATLDLSISQNADVEISKDNHGSTNLTLNVKI